jgi:Domain of unknown function (DUF4397)
MRKADKIKLSVIVGVSLLAFVVGCVDTAVQPIPTSINYQSEVSVVNLTEGTGTATINMYGAIVDQDSLARNILATKIDYSSAQITGTGIAAGSTVPASSYQTVPSGSKAIVVTYSGIAYKDTFQLSADSQYKMRIFFVGDTSAGGRTYVKSDERYTFQTPGSSDGANLFPSGSGWIKIFNGMIAADTVTVKSIEIKGGTLDTTITTGVKYASNTGYIEIPSGNYMLYITTTNNADSVAFTAGSMHRYTAVMYNTEANLQLKVLTDD